MSYITKLFETSVKENIQLELKPKLISEINGGQYYIQLKIGRRYVKNEDEYLTKLIIKELLDNYTVIEIFSIWRDQKLTELLNEN